MATTKDIIVNDDLLDDELRHMPGLRVSDVDDIFKAKAQQKPKQQTQQKPVTQTAKQEQQNGGYAAARFNNGMDCLKACVRNMLPFSALSVLFFYWQQTEQMAESAAFPSIVLCALMAGVGIGRGVGKYFK